MTRYLSVFKAQTEIMAWLRSRGHRVIEDEKEMRGCTTKRRYESFEEAAAAGPLMKRYRCQFCDGWHLATPHALSAADPIRGGK